ncbi:MAG: OmpA family protein [Campylobacterales bacterium]
MMKKVVLTSALAALLLLTGCGPKAQVDPAEATDQKVEAATKPAEETKVDMADQVAVAKSDVQATADEKVAVVAAAVNEKLPAIYFDFDRYNIREDMQSAINDLARIIKAGGNVNFRIEGNCDEWGTEEYNYALGLRRAKSVQDALERAGVSKAQLSLISYGESNPVCTESNRDCWRQNRRVELTILP